ncbi:MAG: nucleotidyltransferase domain-containing protein [Gammaproteobacteria bacterium]
MDAIIQQQLDQIESDYGVRILLAVESGSRAWGIASPDSDYDVRFIYWHPQDWYLSVFEQRDVIELPVDNVLDISGWELRKALRLLWKSNAALLEWLHSPQVYRADAKRAWLDALVPSAFLPLSSGHHYLAMARQSQQALLNNEHVTLKRYCYALRAALCCQWISRYQQVPPVPFRALLNELVDPATAVHAHITRLLADKSHALERDRAPRDPVLDDFLTGLLAECEASMPDNPSQREQSDFDTALRAIIRE